MLQLMHSFRGTTVPQVILDKVRRGEIGSFCLFNYNVASVEQMRAFTESLYQAAREGNQLPPIIGIDQEGGQLMAITHGATELPGNMALGATRSAALAEKAGYVLGREMLAMGINLNFAPSLDINNNPQNPVIGVRSFSDSPELVSILGQAVIKGLQNEGVIATAKHFPGHGDTSADSHHDAPVIHKTLASLHKFELVPFQGAIKGGIKAIMTAHILFPALDSELPATLSSAILQGLLREQLGFNDLIITDAMDMQAVAKRGSLKSVIEALDAGADLVMLGHLEDSLQIDDITANKTNSASLQRIQQLRQTLPTELPSLSIVGCEEHQAIAQEIADNAITVVKEDGLFPLRLAPQAKIAVISILPSNLTLADTSSGVKIMLADAIAKRHDNIIHIELPMFADEATTRSVLEQSTEADVVIIGTILAERDPSQASIVQALIERGQNPIVVSLRTPYDITAFPSVNNYLCAYSIRPVATEAVARVLFGEILAKGVLPCQIPGIMATL